MPAVRILIAEHNTLILGALQRTVENSFDGGLIADCVPVGEVALALERLRNSAFSLVITDWMWPSPVDPNAAEVHPGGRTIAAKAKEAGCLVVVVTQRNQALAEAQLDANVDLVIHWDDLATGPLPLISFITNQALGRGRSSMNQNSGSKLDVFVVYGHDTIRLNGLKKFLKLVGLRPVDFAQALQQTRASAQISDRPVTTYDVIMHGTGKSSAVLILLTPDEVAQSSSDSTRKELRPRPNVIFEAGLAYGQRPSTTAMVRFGDTATWSDVDGVQYLRYPLSLDERKALVAWLEAAGLELDLSDDEWRTASLY